MGTRPSGGVVSAVQAERQFGLGCRPGGMTGLAQFMWRAARILPARLNPRNSGFAGVVRKSLGSSAHGCAHWQIRHSQARGSSTRSTDPTGTLACACGATTGRCPLRHNSCVRVDELQLSGEARDMLPSISPHAGNDRETDHPPRPGRQASRSASESAGTCSTARRPDSGSC